MNAFTRKTNYRNVEKYKIVVKIAMHNKFLNITESENLNWVNI